jgi:DNA-binding LacI/PurR family transcriptional regulator
METYNLPVQGSWIQRGAFTRAGGYHAVKALRGIANQPSAVYVANYEMTIGAILALHEMHVHIPGELSFIGFDHFEAIDVVEPSLTVVEQPIERMGQLAAELLLKRLQRGGNDFPTIIKLNTKMTIRNSVQQL